MGSTAIRSAGIARLGLPAGPLFRPSLQVESAPVLVPSIAGERERRLIAPDQRLYLLGSYGSEQVDNGENVTMRVGAVGGSGRVLGLRPRPVTVDDLPRVLQAVYPTLYQPAVLFFNSSVAAFVGVAWRWRAAVEVFRRYPCPDGLDEIDAWFAQSESCRQQVLAGMVRIDPALADPDRASIWVTTITEDYSHWQRCRRLCQCGTLTSALVSNTMPRRGIKP